MNRRTFMTSVCLFTLSTPYLRADTSNITDQLNAINANVLFMRHALAPGFGDPTDFDVANCNTQRNLNNEGRAQAKAIGAALSTSGLVFDAVYSSQWCRCKDTAELMNVGEVETFPGLNSFFQSHAPKDKTLALLRGKLNQLPKDRLTLMVTHQVVIQAITNQSVSSGGLVAYNTRTQHSERVYIEG